MQTRRRFQPSVLGLPLRIAPSAVAVPVPAAIIAAPAAVALSSGSVTTMNPGDSDIPDPGTTPIPIILSGPPGAGDGTITC
jgi:hypothetical protein